MTESVMNRKAIFSDGTANFVFPPEPKAYERVTIRCRVGKNDVDSVTAIVEEKPFPMVKSASTERFDIYEVSLSLQEKQIGYHFRITKGQESVICNRQGVVEQVDPYFNFCIIPGFSTPSWAKGAVMYQIFVDRFCNGDRSNDVVDDEYTYIGEHVTRITDWNKLPSSMDIRNFYGGDLKGIWQKLDYLQDLG